MAYSDLEEQVLNGLKDVEPVKVVMFGSRALGNTHSDSDLDLLVVTRDDYIPQSFAEKMAVHLRVAAALAEVEKMVPLDLIVHTRAMHTRFLALDSLFARQIRKTGKVLYESHD